MIWVRPKACTDFLTWLIHSWNFPAGWNGPYLQKRIVGGRVLGWEWERTVFARSEEPYSG